MRALVAFDKFKDALSAPEACELAINVLKQRHPTWSFDLCPLADGGDGFCEILTRSVRGEIKRITVTGPRGEPVNASYGLVPGHKIPRGARALFGFEVERPPALVAVVEMATASGLALLSPEQRNPWQTTTAGTGELIIAAARDGAEAILLGVGGSATHDLGTGALSALGLQFVTANGERVHPPIPARWKEIAEIRGKASPRLPKIFIASDVTHPLLGPCGAAATFAPQKGLHPRELPQLENESARMGLMLCTHGGGSDSLMDAPGAGAAGGMPFGLSAAANATVLQGSTLVSAWLDLDNRLAIADVVLTGEGRFDESSLHGKGPGAIVSRALVMGIATHVFAGEVTAGHTRRGLTLHAITTPGTPLPTALRDTRANLVAAVSAAF